MTMSKQERHAFKQFERVGWDKQAKHYNALIGQTTLQAVDALLDAAEVRSGIRLLDVATGPGYVAAQAARRGADAIGGDIAKNMVEEACRRFPGIKFETTDAENLHYADASFDAVVCAFGMLHFPRPGRAVAEAYRVLRPGGRYAFTVWCGPTKARLLALIGEVVQKHADPSVGLPAGPSLFMLSDPWMSSALLEAATFTNVSIEELTCSFAASSPDDIFEAMRKSTVRASYVFARQSPEVQRRIEQALKEEGARELAVDGGRVPCAALLVSGVKATA
jgi:ubiquinone/menaquinone biosynthesis C-methylase UbiE